MEEKRKRLIERNKGITLIALVITIVVLIILATISVNAVIGENGIIKKAQRAAELQTKSNAEETFKLVAAEWSIEKNTKNSTNSTVTLESFLNSKVTDGTIDDAEAQDDGTFILYKNEYTVVMTEEGDLDGNVTKGTASPKVTVSKVVENSDGSGDAVSAGSVTGGSKTLYIMLEATIDGGTTSISPEVPYAVTKNGSYNFTITGTITETGETVTKKVTVKVDQYSVALKAGDFVNYTAGDWTEEEITALGSLYAGEDLPTSSTPNQFGGFKVGDSKDASITPYSTYANTYSGWRVLSNTDGVIKIVHAGTPEGYYHPYGTPYGTNTGYKSEYILNSSTKNSNITEAIKAEVSKTRDWSMYENTNLAESGTAHCLTYSEIIGFSTSDTVRKTGSYYWLANAYESDHLRGISYDGDGSLYDLYDFCFGVRPVVSLKSNIQITGGSGTSADPYTISVN